MLFVFESRVAVTFSDGFCVYLMISYFMNYLYFSAKTCRNRLGLACQLFSFCVNYVKMCTDKFLLVTEKISTLPTSPLTPASPRNMEVEGEEVERAMVYH